MNLRVEVAQGDFRFAKAKFIKFKVYLRAIALTYVYKENLRRLKIPSRSRKKVKLKKGKFKTKLEYLLHDYFLLIF